MADKCSERAGEIIAFLTRLRFLQPKEKQLLLKNIPYKGLVKRLLSLCFAGHIYRFDLQSMDIKITTELRNADERLSLFIKINEMFFAGEITGEEARTYLVQIFKKLHSREFEFYKDLVSGGTAYLDYISYKQALAKKDKDNFVRFMRPCDANPDYVWGGKQYIVQPNYQGHQMRLILRKDRTPMLIGRDQINYANRMKVTLGLANEWLEEVGKDRVEFDAILIRTDKKDRPDLNWKAKDCTLVIYDCIEPNIPLKKRLKKVLGLCNFMKLKKNRRIQAMPTEVMSGAVLNKEAKRYCQNHLPYAHRNGIIVKRWDSGYTIGRSHDWLCLTDFQDKFSGTHTGRATIIGRNVRGDRLFAVNNNGLEVDISINPGSSEYLDRYIGFTVEYTLYSGWYKYKRTLYDKGREV